MLRRKQLVHALMVSVMSASLLGCAHVQTHQGAVVVQQTHDQVPDWVYKKRFFERDNRFFFSGGVENAGDYALARSQARAQAMKVVIDGIQTRAKREYSEALQGRGMDANDLGRYVQDAVAWTSEAVDLQGLMPEEEFMQKLERTDDGRTRYQYNVTGLYSIEKDAYKAAQRRALDRLLNRGQETRDRKAEETAKALLDTLKEQ